MSETDEVLCERRGALGLITLNRPQALNALTLPMVRAMRRALDAWESDAAIACVAVRGAGEKAFCAGGDIRQLYELGRAGRQAEALVFWREEYELNVRIKRYPKPYVALMDGIVMGGGVGVSLHGSHRVAGDRTLFAMPEVGIGFFPDVGATHALPRLPDHMGTYLALTGERIKTADVKALGLATHVARSADHPALIEALSAGEGVDAALARHAADPGPAPLLAHRDLIARTFSGESVAAILARLDGAGDPFATAAAATIRVKSPMSVAIAFAQMRRGRDLSFEEAMRVEFRIVSRICEGHDFYEGVRAVIVDKDGAPRWQPASLDALDPAAVEAHFAPLGPGELKV